MASLKDKISAWFSNSVGGLLGSYDRFLGFFKGFTIDRNTLIFIGFFGLSTLFWFLKALNKEYNTELNYPAKYTDYPEGYVIENELPDKLSILVSDDGFDLLRYKMSSSFIPVGFKVKNIIARSKSRTKTGHAFITSEEIFGEINHQLSSSTKLLRIKPDTIHVYYSKLRSKKVPVYSNLQVIPEKQHMISGNILLKPDSVTVYGPGNVIDTLRCVFTKDEKYHDVSDTLIRNISIKDYDNLEMNKRRVVVTIPIEPFTEKKMSIPVTGREFPDSLRLRTFPGLVDVSFFVGLSKYNDIQPEDIQVFVDYKTIESASNGIVKIQLQYNNNFISNPRLSTSELEYLVEYMHHDQ